MKIQFFPFSILTVFFFLNFCQPSFFAYDLIIINVTHLNAQSRMKIVLMENFPFSYGISITHEENFGGKLNDLTFCFLKFSVSY